MSFFTKIRSSIQRFMYGRNGVDILSRDMNFFALFLMLIGSLLNTYVIYFIGILFFCVSVFRVCSRNIAKRASENSRYFTIRGKSITWFKDKWQYFSNKKSYRYYKCSCGQKLRVPKGRGKIKITCPKCGMHFIKKT